MIALGLVLMSTACGSNDPAAPSPDDTSPADERGEDGGDASEPSDSEAAEVSFEGETIRIVVGFGPGGGFDQVTRLIASELGEHLPGSPSVVVENLPGAGSVVAGNTVYEADPEDGLVLVNLNFARAVEAMFGTLPNVTFDPLGFAWIGEPAGVKEPSVFYVRSEVPAETVFDLQELSETIFVGGTGRGSTDALPMVVLAEAGLPIEVVYGYDGTSDVALAIQQGELDGYWGGLGTVRRMTGGGLETGDYKIIASMGTNDELQAAGVPDVADPEVRSQLGLDEIGSGLLDIVELGETHLRAYAAPPGTPPEVIEAVREAFKSALEDPELQASLEAIEVLPGWTSGDVFPDVLTRAEQVPADVVAAYDDYTSEAD